MINTSSADFYNVSLDYIAGRTNLKNLKNNLQLNGEQLETAEKFSKLTERNKGKLELFIEQLLEKQENERFKAKEAKSS